MLTMNSRDRRLARPLWISGALALICFLGPEGFCLGQPIPEVEPGSTNQTQVELLKIEGSSSAGPEKSESTQEVFRTHSPKPQPEEKPAESSVSPDLHSTQSDSDMARQDGLGSKPGSASRRHFWMIAGALSGLSLLLALPLLASRRQGRRANSAPGSSVPAGAKALPSPPTEPLVDVSALGRHSAELHPAAPSPGEVLVRKPRVHAPFVNQTIQSGPEVSHSPELTRHLSAWLKEKLVRRLVEDRSQLLHDQQTALLRAEAIAERLARFEVQLEEQQHKYEQRIENLTAQLLAAREENRTLIQSRISQAQAEIENARSSNPRQGAPATLPETKSLASSVNRILNNETVDFDPGRVERLFLPSSAKPPAPSAPRAAEVSPGPAPETSDPVDFDELFEEGFIAFRQGRYAEALKAWRQAALLQPQDRRLQYNIKLAARKLNDQIPSRP